MAAAPPSHLDSTWRVMIAGPLYECVCVAVLKIKLHVIRNSKKGTCCTALHDEERLTKWKESEMKFYVPEVK